MLLNNIYQSILCRTIQHFPQNISYTNFKFLQISWITAATITRRKIFKVVYSLFTQLEIFLPSITQTSLDHLGRYIQTFISTQFCNILFLDYSQNSKRGGATQWFSCQSCLSLRLDQWDVQGGCELCRQPSVDMKYHLNIKCELQYNCNRS